MKAYSFRLDSVLRVRRVEAALARQPVAALSRSLVASMVREHEVTAVYESIIGASDVESGETFLAVQEQGARLATTVAVSRSDRVVLEERLRAARADALEAERRLAALERLDERSRQVWMADAEREDVATLDDFATLAAQLRLPWRHPVSIDAVSALPASVVALEAQFVQFEPLTTSDPAVPTDPFAVLLDASATSSEATPSPDTMTSPQFQASATSVQPQFVSLVSAQPSQDVPPASTASDAAIVSEAERYLGVPYQWGGSTPSGFDCSGLVQYVFAQLGVDLPRTAAEQSTVGTPVSTLAEAQPGDLLFFEPGKNGAPAGEAGHVAIYLGNDEMIAAPETGESVQVQAVPSEPIAIRRITVSGAGGVNATGAPGNVEMGNVSVPGQYVGLVNSAAAASGTPAQLLAAIVSNESDFDPSAVSSAGAEGIAQIMPVTAAANGIDPFAPTSAIPGAASLLAQYHAAFGSWTDAVAAYAAGPAAVQAAGGVPLDGTTPSYVARTLGLAGMELGA